MCTLIMTIYLVNLPPFMSKVLSDRGEELDSQRNIHRRFRISLAILTVLICSFHVHTTAMYSLKHSRNLHRVLNRQLLQHDDLDIYWFGYRAGQYLINYPIQEYYFIDQFSQFLVRLESMMGNLQSYSFGNFDQYQLNHTSQKITVFNKKGDYQLYNWTIQGGFQVPFTSSDITSIREVLSDCLWMQISITGFNMNKGQIDVNNEAHQWDISAVVEVFSETSIFVTIVLQEKMYLGYQHIFHLILGFGKLALFAIQLRQRNKVKRLRLKEQGLVEKGKGHFSRIEANDVPDLLVAFFLIYSSFVSMVSLFTVRYLLIIDGVTCFISWLYILKLNTESDDYHISFLIKKSYLYAGRLFVSFGPMFIGFCLFALTVFCRYSVLFTNFHKTVISIFCVCYYNMTYEQFRTTERSNPISAIFFTSLIMIFTVCIYSGMLVSVFCSYMWNRRENKNKQQLMQSLKIECSSCHYKYSYAEGYQASVEATVLKREEELLDIDGGEEMMTKYRNSLREKIYFLQQKFLSITNQNEQIIAETDDSETYSFQRSYANELKETINSINQIIKRIREEQQT